MKIFIHFLDNFTSCMCQELLILFIEIQLHTYVRQLIRNSLVSISTDGPTTNVQAMQDPLNIYF